MLHANRILLIALSACVTAALLYASVPGSTVFPEFFEEEATPQDSIKKNKGDLPYPIKDRQGDFVTDDDDNPFLLDDPESVEKSVEYDPETDRYILTETMDGRDVKPPTYLTFDEYLDYQKEQTQQDYWKERAESITLIEEKGIIPKLYVTKSRFGEWLGSNTIDIKPSGNIDLTLGGNVQKIDNPTLTENQRKSGGFDFDMRINMNVVGKIGDKIKINLNYNTEATFDFENQIKLNYEGQEDDIIKAVEAGNVAFPLPTTLIQGSQSLFGLKTRLQFGRLTMTSVYSQQKSQMETLTIDKGAQTSNFEVYADQYDENRHFFLSHYFRDNYENALSTYPVISSLANVTRLEVWVTNRTAATENARDIIGFMDLAEPVNIYSTTVTPLGGANVADNGANDLYGRLKNDPNARNINSAVVTLEQNFNLIAVQDFEKTYARKLNTSEYNFNPQLGILSLNQALYADEVLSVAYEYTLNGEVYKVGEFAQDIGLEYTTDTNSIARPTIIFLKLLKGTSARPKLPIWDLMMKNVYPLGAFQVNKEDFKLNIIYQDPGGGQKRFIPEGNLSGIPLISVLSLDKVNMQNDPQPDGVFDFISGITINPSNGRVYFPILEPFGSNLRQEFVDAGDAGLADKYVYQQLYDSTKVIAQQFPQLNRFVLQGTFKSAVSNEISLGAFNVPQGSVKVTAGGQQLVEGRDYSVDYSLGRVKIINEGVLNSGVPINVSYENNALFGFQTRTMFGTRLDYKVSDKFSLGGTLLMLRERPFTQKVNIGEDPIKNMQSGFDFNYNTESQFLTWLVDKLPLYETKEASSFSLMGEMAHLNPGHQKAIGKDGTVYIDDFEGTSSTYDLRYPANKWVLASTPKNALNASGRELFPEAQLTDSLLYAYNRARLCWYNIDPLFSRDNSATPDHISNDDQSNHYVREIDEQEVFPNRTRLNPGLNNNLLTFDLAYYPRERGHYNYEVSPTPFSQGIDPSTGLLLEPESRWGGVMRDLDNTDFEAANIEYIEFWVLDPFIYNQNSSGGELYINLGNISEDIQKDSRKFFENGLQAPGSQVPMDSTNWGRVPITQPITNAFDNDPDKRAWQDIGLDGLNDDGERAYFNDYLSRLQQAGASQAVIDKATNDPSSDNYHYFLGSDYDSEQRAILERYKRFNNQQGNSPISSSGQTISEAATNIPDSEDLNRDFTVNEAEEYFQYRLKLEPGMRVGDPFINDKVDATVTLANGNIETISWYQFRIPISEYERKVGSIPDFRSIRFMRMFLTGFEDSVVLRFARLELTRNQWRRYQFSLLDPGEYVPDDEASNTYFNVAAVNVEENSEKFPVPYSLPPGILREQNITSTNVNALQNEQSLQLDVCDLKDGDSRAVFKNLNLDLRTYKRLKMFIHGESGDVADPLNDCDVRVFMRLGSDFTNNYYEYEIPLRITPAGSYNPDDENDQKLIWPEENFIDLALDSLYKVKILRSLLPNYDPTSPFIIYDARGNKFTVVGNPDLGLVKTAMLGVRNPKAEAGSDSTCTDDGQAKCVEVWFNELRLLGLDEGGGFAALARMETKLADLGGLNFSTQMHTIGYGQIEQKVQERFRDTYWNYDLAGNIDLGKFIPEKVGLRIPMYAGITQGFSTPQYDPYELDVPLEVKLRLIAIQDDKLDYKRQAQTRQTIKSLNFSNVRFVSPRSDKKLRVYDPSNINLTFAYSNTLRTTPFIEKNEIRQYTARLGYNFSPQAKYFTPFGKMIKSKSKYLTLVKDLNFNFIPNNLAFSTEMSRMYAETVLRQIDADEIPSDPTFEKYFTWDRIYGFKYNPMKSVTVDFSAINNASIDEPNGRLDTDEKKDSLWNNIFDWGRTTRYQHNFSSTYNAPLNKIPLLDWTQARASYGTTYSWATGKLYRDPNLDQIVDNPLGNVISNTRDIKLNGELDFRKLYDKFTKLKPYNSTKTRTEQDWKRKEREKKIAENEKKKRKIDDDIDKLRKEIEKIEDQISEIKKDTIQNKREEIKKLKKQKKEKKQKIKKLQTDRGKIQNPESPAVSPFIRPFIALKRVSMTFSKTQGSAIPGYMPKTKILGQADGFNKPGLNFIFGYQPDLKWLDDAAAKGWITSDTSLNFQVLQSTARNLNFKAVVEPFRDFKVDLTVDRTITENYSEYFKKQYTNSPFDHLTPQTTGSYTVTYISIQTLFQKSDDNGFTDAFRQFQDVNRSIISNRLANGNPNSNGNFILPDTANTELQNFNEGYGPYSQDVLIPSFIAAYTNQSPNDVKLDPFKVFPLPNWRVTYNGLSNIPIFKKVMNSINITHGYSSTYTINNFQSNLKFDGDNYFRPSELDELNNNFISYYSIPQVVITEQLSPLIGVDITWKNNMTSKFDFKKTRNLAMSVIDYQISESRTTEFTFGFGYRLKGLVIPFKIKGKKKKLENELNFKCDVSYRDNVTFSQRLDQQVSEPTRGMKTIRVSPSIDYIINSKLRVKLFFDRNRSIPATSASFPITNTRAGITISFSLAP